MTDAELRERFSGVRWNRGTDAYIAGYRAAQEDCAKLCESLIPPFESYRHGTTDYEDGVIACAAAIRALGK